MTWQILCSLSLAFLIKIVKKVLIRTLFFFMPDTENIVSQSFKILDTVNFYIREILTADTVKCSAVLTLFAFAITAYAVCSYFRGRSIAVQFASYTFLLGSIISVSVFERFECVYLALAVAAFVTSMLYSCIPAEERKTTRSCELCGLRRSSVCILHARGPRHEGSFQMAEICCSRICIPHRILYGSSLAVTRSIQRRQVRDPYLPYHDAHLLSLHWALQGKIRILRYLYAYRIAVRSL